MPRMRLGDMLIRAGLIDEMQLNSALAHQRQWGGKLGDILVQQDVLDEMMLWRGLSRQLDVPLVSLTDVRIAPELLSALPAEMCERLEMIPIARDDRSITIATSDPNNIGALDEVAFRTGLKVKTVLAPAREVEWALRSGYHGERAPCPPPRQKRRFDTGFETMNAPTAASPLPRSPSRPPQPGVSLPPQFATSSPPPMASQSAPPPFLSTQPSPQLRIASLPHAHTPVPNTPIAELAAARMGAAPQARMGGLPGASTLAPPAGAGIEAPTTEEQLAQANEMLRALVELCIQRGVFTRDELWARLMTK
ncbi:MAG: hypothetical protein HYS27_20585 [Deltaproteobacteria bacterium]|nr:hypothetical protein [Deltaproteobacteria bacterium]